ncbi:MULTISPECIES: N-acetylmuramic acid 6-phosphate etherase [Enterococcus]|jgi:N-acetylmuramic acid 6-phosphate etherase|uniref:N-acetylmuramic acid 6-phosphate etherase n=1 Tax=Enterococcus TaxID=1350 RepID=UPI0001F0D9D9|nr:N-acetylmuramic acid 6-phosphate etherase [Enterococcus faecalis]EFT93468.1 N-acetylmuramic acid 6-phosphate etherase [Enterococcus faecalis TX0012]EGO2632670.1 N-acetylmuramic acid 6-phosphate etherase [Enterococcus faecalis]EGO2833424.1 N-acetylmuramic acid 6-phosphate etherase [Enterococcus faecalis]EGO5250632.1 N-acetylmuramic acid 6-phosphate etherase [Enterococcus faecalis]EGO7618468.1 N-acetylmuramic acid 6-phosphate etherase [Enterococcus faecalis]
MNLEGLTTEARNEATKKIDQVSTLEMVTLINQEDQKVAQAIEKVLPQIAAAIDAAAERFKKGGRLIYCGAGTSGRLGALDAIELTPTYSVSPERAFGILAGGEKAMYQAIEGAEDSKELAIEDLTQHQLTARDVVIAIAASGRTPYAVSAIEYGKKVGALTISVTCNNQSPMNQLAEIGIAPIVGPEVITGSTRMKAGSAQKMVLNMFSTGIMVKVGNIYQNLMVNVQPTNEKLIQRATNIIKEAAEIEESQAKEYLEAAQLEVAPAIVMAKAHVDFQKAKQLLADHDGRISEVLA